ncbi:hypothetical protein AB0M23_32455, partial [Streptomyces sp. NPDC052077]
MDDFTRTAEAWLTKAVRPEIRDEARRWWTVHGSALLPLGTAFSAVRVPDRAVHRAAGCRCTVDEGACVLGAADVDEFLGRALGGGPVICDPLYRRYYALVPPGRGTSTEGYLGEGTLLGVPRTDRVGPGRGAYWSVPVEPGGGLCDPAAVARLVT